MHNSLISHYYNEKQNKLNIILFFIAFFQSLFLLRSHSVVHVGNRFFLPQRTLFDFCFSARRSLNLVSLLLNINEKIETMILTIAKQRTVVVISLIDSSTDRRKFKRNNEHRIVSMRLCTTMEERQEK